MVSRLDQGRARALCERLRSAGLREKLVVAALGYRTSIHAALRRAHSSETIDQLSLSASGALIAFFVCQRSIGRARAAAIFGDQLETAAKIGLVAATDDGTFEARYALLPHRGLLVCAPWSTLPDDSSLHLLGALPANPTNWLDIGTGSAVLPLLRANGLSTASDLHADCIEAAAIGAALNRRSNLKLVVSDLFDNLDPRRYGLVTFNAPIESAAELLARFWASVGSWVERDGLVLVHSIVSRESAVVRAISRLEGSFVRCCYTPQSCSPSFAVSGWRPGGPTEYIERDVVLTAAQPHMARDWTLAEDFG